MWRPGCCFSAPSTSRSSCATAIRWSASGPASDFPRRSASSASSCLRRSPPGARMSSCDCWTDSPVPPINLYSDTQTRPTDGMRAAIARAEVGDEQRGRDPTTARLQDRVAELLGHEAAVFLPSGTMCNEIAIRLHIRPGGDEMILDRTAHPVSAEAGGPAQLAGAMVRILDGDRGVFAAELLETAVRTPRRHEPRSRLVCVEQTSNLGGGRIWPLETLRGVLEVARHRGLRAHMDGARLMNAVVATGI